MGDVHGYRLNALRADIAATWRAAGQSHTAAEVAEYVRLWLRAGLDYTEYRVWTEGHSPLPSIEGLTTYSRMRDRLSHHWTACDACGGSGRLGSDEGRDAVASGGFIDSSCYPCDGKGLRRYCDTVLDPRTVVRYTDVTDKSWVDTDRPRPEAPEVPVEFWIGDEDPASLPAVIGHRKDLLDDPTGLYCHRAVKAREAERLAAQAEDYASDDTAEVTVLDRLGSARERRQWEVEGQGALLDFG